MPFYAYECPSCGHVTELFVWSHTARQNETVCHKCGDTSNFVIAPTITPNSMREKRLQSEKVSVPVPKDYSISVDNFKVVESPPHVKKHFRNNGRKNYRKKKRD